jgi:hypothetical protein
MANQFAALSITPAAHPGAGENDSVFLFPRAGGRDNKLWASSSFLARQAPYFAALFASPPCASFDTLDPPGSASTWSKPLQEGLQKSHRGDVPGIAQCYDSDDEAITSLLVPEYARKPRNLVNLPFSRPAPTDAPLKYVIVKYATFRTFRAVLHYLSSYTISFSCLVSARSSSQRGKMENGHLAASPKSVYRLARQLGLERLEKLAKDDLVSQIGPENWVSEFYSDATTEWEGITDALLEALDGNKL